jgi:teichuronic acid biosynthesis glycosyltransferase TuaC
MHLVLLSSQFPTPRDPNGGIFTAQLADALATRVSLTVVCPVPWCPNLPILKNIGTCRWYAGIPRELSRNSVRVHYVRFPFIPKISRFAQPWLQAPNLFAFLRQLNRSRPIDAINAHWMYPDAVAATWVAKKLRIPILLTALGSDINVAAKHAVTVAQIRWAIRHANGVSGVSRALVTQLTNLGAEAGDSYFLPNGVDSKKFFMASSDESSALRAELGLEAHRRYLVFVGRLHPVKGLICLVEAIAKLKAEGRLHFDTILVGEGELRTKIENLIAQYSLNNQFRLTGEVSHEEVPKWLRAADAFCLPSITEGMPNVVLEAQACGLPVIATSVGALPELISPETGILVPTEDSISLANALEDAMGRTWNRDVISRNPMAVSWEQIADQYLDVIKAIQTQRISTERARPLQT